MGVLVRRRSGAGSSGLREPPPCSTVGVLASEAERPHWPVSEPTWRDCNATVTVFFCHTGKRAGLGMWSDTVMNTRSCVVTPISAVWQGDVHFRTAEDIRALQGSSAVLNVWQVQAHLNPFCSFFRVSANIPTFLQRREPRLRNVNFFCGATTPVHWNPILALVAFSLCNGLSCCFPST